MLITNMKWIVITLTALTTLGACAQTSQEPEVTELEDKITIYTKTIVDDNKPSKAIGLVNKGSLENGKLMPFSGENFTYFDTSSYLYSRAFVHSDVRQAVLDSYSSCDSICPEYHFTLMECSNKKGGKIWPHRTHQNGMSIDFAMPLKKSNKQYRDLDLIGKDHYFMDFDNDGKYIEDTTVSVNFEIVCKHILELEKSCRKNGLKIKKVIIKTELKDDLYASKSGQKIKSSGIYVVKKLEPLINQLHDDHYHVDFAFTE